jgi:CBS domain-containing protein
MRIATHRDLQDAIVAAPDVVSVVAAGLQRPRLIARMVESGVDEVEVGRIGSTMVDELTVRLLDLAFDRLGRPPVPWAWLALGSSARREQAIGTDQDHALAFDPQTWSLDDLDAYFLEVARAVTSGLEAAGIPRCHAEVVAENRALRRPLEHWVTAFRAWMDDPDPIALRQSAILFDFRRVAGDLDVESAFRTAIGGHPHATFLSRHVRRALETRPPTRRFRPFVVRARGEHRGTLDLKHGGLMPIVDLARIYAHATGSTATGTLDRLRESAERGALDAETAESLAEAFRCMLRLRLRRHADRERRGETPDDLVDPRALTLDERTELLAALRNVRRAQLGLRTWRRLRPAPALAA